MKIALASDHGGFEFKVRLKQWLKDKNIEFQDFGTYSKESCDYPDFGIPATESVANKKNKYAILICNNGIGMSILANKIKHIKAAVVYSEKTAKQTREHHDSNVLCLGGQEFNKDTLIRFVKIWLESDFRGERHKRRIRKVENLDVNNDRGENEFMNIKSELEVYKRVLQYNNVYYEKNCKRLNITINFNNIPDCELDHLAIFINSLMILYQNAHISMAFSSSYNKISEEFRENSEILCNRYKFYERNYYFRYFIHQYFTILDYILFILNISAELGLKERKVSFKKIKPKINSNKEFSEIWKQISEIYKKDRDRDLYYIQKHRYMIGIDHSSKKWNRSNENEYSIYTKLFKFRLEKRLGKKIDSMRIKEFSAINWADIEYDKYSEKFQNKMNDLNKLFDLLWKLPKVKDVVEINENNNKEKIFI
jgi:ribose 5-phosphate isomerase B